MTSTPTTPSDIPTVRQLVRTTIIALAIATVLLVTMVLPAEYAIDPVRTGRWLGLTAIANPPVHPIQEMASAGKALSPVSKGPMAQYPGEFKVDVYTVTLEPYEYIEYKYHLEKGATLLYAWSATAPLVQDFHGERANAAEGQPAEESFDKADRRASTGSLTAPFTGIHGWYWENPGATPVTIKLTSSGYYASAVEIRSDRSRHPRVLRALDSLAPTGDKTAAPAGP
jgi:hypothetical protein